LLASQLRYKTLVQGTYEGIALTSQGKFIDCNDQLLKMLGYDRDELIGQSVADFIPHEDQARVLANIKKGKESQTEHIMIRKDGTPLTVEAHGTSFTQDDTSMRLTSIRDVTERVSNEKSYCNLMNC